MIVALAMPPAPPGRQARLAGSCPAACPAPPFTTGQKTPERDGGAGGLEWSRGD
jgi:hypothetical protein